jgi:tetratricopeptide (TPR) repeat protein
MPPARAQTQTKKPQDHKPSRARTVALALLVVLAAAVPYARTLDFGFVWDDHFVIGKHLEIHGWSDLVRIWSIPFDTLLHDEKLRRTYFRPATLYSLAVDDALSPGNPRLFHATNVVLYAAGCLFLWLAAWELSGRPLASAAGAVLYALHPVHPESVAFISGRTDVLAGLFLFAALWAALRFGPKIKDVRWKLAPAAPLLLLSLLAKEIGLFATPLFPLALWVKERRLTAPQVGIASIPVVGAALFYLAVRLAVLQSTSLPTVTPVEGTVAQILTSFTVVARYVPLLLMPTALSARHQTAEAHAVNLMVLAGIVILAAIAVGLFAGTKRRSPWVVPLFLYASTLLPLCYVRLLSGPTVAERFLFIPSGAVALAVGLLPGALAPRAGRAGHRKQERDAGAGVSDAGPGFSVICGVVAFALLTLLLPRIALWRDDGTLFLSMLRDSPESPDVHALLGGYFYETRDLGRSIHHYKRALQLYPRSHELLLSLGAAEDESGQKDSAFAHIRLLNRLEPQYAPGLYALGNLYARIDHPDSAEIAYRAALERMPGFQQAENNLGAVIERQGRLEEALGHYEKALAIDPTFKDAQNNRRRLTAEIADSTRLQSARPTRPARATRAP